MEEIFATRRSEMVAAQIERRGISQARLLAVLREIPRHRFVSPDQEAYAYEDHPLSIGYGQTISQPYIVALMTSLLKLGGKETVLEIGTGSGYQAAILGRLAHQVHSIERIPALADNARQVLASLDIYNVTIHIIDGSAGLLEFAPYQGILVTAAAPAVPQPLLDQLSEGGRLVIPVGSRGFQTLKVFYRSGSRFEEDDVTPVAFVPLRGQYGFPENGW
jgi:protein-L-isoaspartate(D-aspartate) O-methyltransferase